MRSTLYLLSIGAALAAGPVRFMEHTIANGLKGGYQVTAVDLNADGKPDLIALASGMSELVWFENPTWVRHVLGSGFQGLINLAALDVGGDGIPEIVVASGFSMEAAKSAGIVQVLQHRGDPRQPWSATGIDRLPTSHRLRWADFDGSGRKVLVNAPLTGAAAAPPDYRGRTPLVYYRPGEWKRVLISDQNEGVVHGLDVFDWDGGGHDDILTASFAGIHRFVFRDGRWTRIEIVKGDPAPWPKSGSSEVAVGRIGSKRYLCSIEPWHGNQVAVYTQGAGGWRRQVIDASFIEGHTLRTVDLNGDGNDEIVAGYRGEGHAVYVYYAEDASGTRWSRHLLDGGVAASSCAAADLNGDGRVDLACIGSSTANLKWYENAGVTPAR